MSGHSHHIDTKVQCHLVLHRPIINLTILLMLSMRQASAAQTTGRKCNIFGKNVKIVEFHYHIQNSELCIQISTNKPSIGLVIPEITCEMLEF